MAGSDQAIIGFEKVLKFNPNHVQSHGNMGLCYSIPGEREKALKANNKALELDPDYAPAQINRTALLALKEGETFPGLEMNSVNYYREKVGKEKRPFRFF